MVAGKQSAIALYVRAIIIAFPLSPAFNAVISLLVAPVRSYFKMPASWLASWLTGAHVTFEYLQLSLQRNAVVRVLKSQRRGLKLTANSSSRSCRNSEKFEFVFSICCQEKQFLQQQQQWLFLHPHLALPVQLLPTSAVALSVCAKFRSTLTFFFLFVLFTVVVAVAAHKDTNIHKPLNWNVHSQINLKSRRFAVCRLLSLNVNCLFFHLLKSSPQKKSSNCPVEGFVFID